MDDIADQTISCRRDLFPEQGRYYFDRWSPDILTISIVNCAFALQTSVQRFELFVNIHSKLISAKVKSLKLRNLVARSSTAVLEEAVRSISSLSSIKQKCMAENFIFSTEVLNSYYS